MPQEKNNKDDDGLPNNIVIEQAVLSDSPQPSFFPDINEQVTLLSTNKDIEKINQNIIELQKQIRNIPTSKDNSLNNELVEVKVSLKVMQTKLTGQNKFNRNLIISLNLIIVSLIIINFFVKKKKSS